jgi:EmrB/QacA subfamily drug resistance transporter
MPDQRIETEASGYRPILFTITIAVFMCLLDSHIVRICLPVIAQEFGISSGQTAWINLAYLLVVTPGLPVFGKISDIVGHRTIFILGYLVFITGSMLCGISPNLYVLVISRFLQGLGGVMLIASGPSMIPHLIPANKRGFAFGLQATAAGLGISLGAPLGGFLTELLSWRYIFYINVPVAVAGIVMAIRYIPQEPHADRLKSLVKRLDIAGSFYLYSCLFCITVGLSLVSKIKTGPAPFFASMVFGTIFLILFLRREKRSAEPIIDTSLFSKPFILIMFSTFIGYMLMTGNAFMMPFYLMTSLELTPVRSGLMILFFSLSFSFFSSLAGRLADKNDPKLLGSLGMFMTAAAVSFFVFVIANRSVFQTALFLLLYGSAFAFFVAPTNKLLISYIPKNKQGVANGIYRTAVFLASLVGLSLYGSLSDHVGKTTMVPLFSTIYLWSILLPLGSFVVLYFSRLPSPLADQPGRQ